MHYALRNWTMHQSGEESVVGGFHECTGAPDLPNGRYMFGTSYSGTFTNLTYCARKVNSGLVLVVSSGNMCIDSEANNVPSLKTKDVYGFMCFPSCRLSPAQPLVVVEI